MTSIKTATEYLVQDRATKEPVLQPWLASGELIMVYAPRGVGKSLFALSMAYSLSSGVPFLGWETRKRCRVCYIEAEMSVGSMVPRMLANDDALIQSLDPKWLTIVSRDPKDNHLANIGTPEGQRELWPILMDHDLIILDNLTSAALPVDSRDDDLKIWNRMKPFNFNLRNHGKTFIIVHHSGKSGQQLGTVLRENDMDTIIHLSKPVKPLHPERACMQIEFEKLRNVPSGTVDDLYAEYYVENHRAMWHHSPLTTVLARQVREMHRKIKNKTTLSMMFHRPLWQIVEILDTPEPTVPVETPEDKEEYYDLF